MTSRAWEPGAVTGLGSLPGDDPGEAVATVFGELPALPHLPELPARGAGSQLIGRTAALLADLPVEIVPTGWRIAAHAGHDLRLARDDLARDLDGLEERADGYVGPLKVQAAGPWTLAASLELANGHAILADHGAVKDLQESLAEGLRVHLADLVARVPGAVPVLQLDEPSLPAVLAARIPTASGYGTLRSVAPEAAGQGMQDVLRAAPEGGRVVHCCAPDVPLALLRAAGADALSLDATLLGRRQYDALGEAVDAGVSLWLGVLPAVGAAPDLTAARTLLHRLWGELGFPPASLAQHVVPTPTCGLAGATPARARRMLAVLRDVGRSLLEGYEEFEDPEHRDGRR